MKKNIIFLCMLLTSTGIIAQQQTKIKYAGSSTIGNYINLAEPVYNKAKFSIETQSESTGGEQAIISGSADIAGVARTPDSDVLAKGVISTLIGWDAIAVVTNSGNNITNLSEGQLRDIFTGKISNWKELGGNDIPIQHFITNQKSASRNIFRSIILKNDDYSGGTIVLSDIDIVEKVKNTSGGIGFISLSFLNGNMNDGLMKKIAVNGNEADKTNPNYSIKRPLYLLWLPGNEAVAEFIKWSIGEQGQIVLAKKFIANSKFVKQIQKSDKGTLLVYTETSGQLISGNYYYPYQPYEILNSGKEVVKYVPNHLSNTDENPTPVSLTPGTYLIRPEGSNNEFWITIEADETTVVDIKKLVLEAESTEQKKIVPQKESSVKKTIQEKTKFYSDFRFRFEEDWDSRKTDGTYRDDRGRLRIRFRVGFDYNWNEHLSFGGRIRAGNKLEQQSPHQTLGDEFEPKTINLDKAYLKGNYTKAWWWIGKNNFPFWKQNELWWHDDVLPEGVALGGKFMMGNKISFKPTIGYFIINSLGKGIENDPALKAGQLAVEIKLKKLGITLASGYYGLNDMPNINDGAGTSTLDYSLINSGIKFDIKTKLPVSVGFDLMNNLEDYADDTLISKVYRNQTTGYVANLNIGQLKEKNDFLIGYYYAYIPKLSVVDYLSQDDWLRWNYNNVSGTRSSNFQGHEIRLGYAFGANFNVVARAYFVEGIVTTGNFKETNNRFRLDFNIGF